MTRASFEEQKKLNFFLFSDLYGRKNNNNLLPEKLSTSKQLRQPLQQQQQQQQPTPNTAEATGAATVVTIQVYFSPLQKTTFFCEAL